MNERDDEILGQALGRAVDAQVARETPFPRSKLAAELERPRRGAFWWLGQAALAAAALVLLIGLGAFLAQLRSPQDVTASPTPSAQVVVPTPTSDPSATPLPGDVKHDVFYCGRGDAPPVEIHGDKWGNGATPQERIRSRLLALQSLAEGIRVARCVVGYPTTAKLASVSVQGDVATVDFTVASDDWGYTPTSLYDPLIAEIVYTASEEPGIHRVRITQNGGQLAWIREPSRGAQALPGVRLTDALGREGVLPYDGSAKSDAITTTESAPASTATTRFSVDEVAPGVARFVIELKANDATQGTRWMPGVSAQLGQNDELKNPNYGKWLLTVDVANARTSPPAEMHYADGYGWQVVDRSPLRAIHLFQRGPASSGISYQLALDDARPWRVGLLFDPVRIVVDVGAPAHAVSSSNVIYSPLFAEQVGRTFTVSGMARAFEAHVVWRIQDIVTARVVASGSTLASLGTSAVWGAFEATIALPASVSPGSYSLVIVEPSAKDGSDVDPVRIPVQVR